MSMHSSAQLVVCPCKLMASGGSDLQHDIKYINQRNLVGIISQSGLYNQAYSTVLIQQTTGVWFDMVYKLYTIPVSCTSQMPSTAAWCGGAPQATVCTHGNEGRGKLLHLHAWQSTECCMITSGAWCECMNMHAQHAQAGLKAQRSLCH